ncbi:MAG: ZIP family metal transporter, partial [Candidatus Tectomicrobia bacterium]
ILLFRHYSKRVIVLFLSLFSLATPLGTIVAYVLLKNQGEHLVTAAITISAGTFLAIATSDLLPELHPEHAGGNSYLNLVSLLCGLGLIWFIPV